MAENQVLVRYFAAAADIIGRDEETITFIDSPSLGDLTYPISGKVDVLPPFAGG
ncbi:hypothetical protein ACFVKB_41165 [Rhodococcus sp. NPDC127530]|uniref:hypothetical protein n=1 Tax=unclassified Rhodococcus (in: high G+C Gram-positive bacteria) TaxID=192944 RepID=UPI00362FC499